MRGAATAAFAFAALMSAKVAPCATEVAPGAFVQDDNPLSLVYVSTHPLEDPQSLQIAKADYWQRTKKTSFREWNPDQKPSFRTVDFQYVLDAVSGCGGADAYVSSDEKKAPGVRYVLFVLHCPNDDPLRAISVITWAIKGQKIIERRFQGRALPIVVGTNNG